MTLHAWLVSAGIVVLALGFLWAERLSVERRLRAVKLRVAVTGTRGKSSVTRLLAAALRESGLRVLAKTTGSAAMVLLPDGTEREIRRPGRPTILEQRSLLRLAVRHKAQALVSEMMSISPECLRVEAGKLLKPDLLLVTNVRLDHREEQGATKDEIARSLSAAFHSGCTVIVPNDEFAPGFERAAVRVGAKLVRLTEESERPGDKDLRAIAPTEFKDNIRLALAAAELCGIKREAALRGMAEARSDPGGLAIFRAKLGSPVAAWFLASVFAANDPESSGLALAKLDDLGRDARGERRAILNLRDDRGDRTVQWLDALRGGFFDGFDRVYVVGSPAVVALKRRIRRLRKDGPLPEGRISILAERSPEKIMEIAAAEPGSDRGGLIIGLGNMGGLGRLLLDHWERIGERLEPGRA